MIKILFIEILVILCNILFSSSYLNYGYHHYQQDIGNHKFHPYQPHPHKSYNMNKRHRRQEIQDYYGQRRRASSDSSDSDDSESSDQYKDECSCTCEQCYKPKPKPICCKSACEQCESQSPAFTQTVMVYPYPVPYMMPNVMVAARTQVTTAQATTSQASTTQTTKAVTHSAETPKAETHKTETTTAISIDEETTQPETKTTDAIVASAGTTPDVPDHVRNRLKLRCPPILDGVCQLKVSTEDSRLDHIFDEKLIVKYTPRLNNKFDRHRKPVLRQTKKVPSPKLDSKTDDDLDYTFIRIPNELAKKFIVQANNSKV